MRIFTCPGLPASWVNAWLAVVGVTVLDPRIRLHWTLGDAPVAVLSAIDTDPVDALADSWPSEACLRDLPIAEQWNDAGELKRKVPVDQFVKRVVQARSHPYSWTLSSTLTDLSVEKDGSVAHAPFDPPGPGTTKWLHHRLLQMHKHAGSMSRERLCTSLCGRLDRVKGNGLGFDSTRLGSLADNSDIWVEPVVELLAFFGLALLPVRALGVDGRLGGVGIRSDQRQRGWQRGPQPDGPRRFVWPAWQQPLDVAAVDALLDRWRPWHRQSWAALGVHAGWRSVPYEPRSRSSDRTRAIASEML